MDVRRPAAILLAATLAAGCGTTQTVRLDQGPVQPKYQALETELLEDARKFRELFDRSGAIYQDPFVETYLKSCLAPLAPTLDPNHPVQFDVKVVRDPTLNAYTLGDGGIYVNSGLIARLKTRQQVAFVLGHELAHIVNRDVVYFADNYHKKTIAAKLGDLVLTPALAAVRMGGVGSLGVSLAYAASVSGYGREREAQADADSLKAIGALGYDEREALRVFESFLKEHERYDRGIELGFLSSHPSNNARMELVREAMGPKALDVFAPEQPDEDFLTNTQALRIDNAALNIQFERYYHAVEDLQIILLRTPKDARARFYLAEAYRLIAEDPKKLKKELSRSAWARISDIGDRDQQEYWQSRADEEYQAAITHDVALPEPHRGLGLLRLAQQRPAEAVESFSRYLLLAPNAKDRRYVTSLLEQAMAQAGPDA